MKVQVRVDGLQELDAALGQFTPTKRRAIGRVALDNGGEIAAKAMRARAPVASGNTRESVDVSGTLSPAQKAEHRKFAEQERFIGPGNMPQAHLREFGGDGNPPDPFVRPGWDETKGQVLDRIADELWIGIEKAATSAAKRAARGK